jgi:hypothetical protein
VSGQHIGKSELLDDSASPVSSLAKMIDKKWHWGIDYSQATDEEKREWYWADVAGRAMLAQAEGRSLYFDGIKYFDPFDLQDAIIGYGLTFYDVLVDRDDENGLFLELRKNL